MVSAPCDRVLAPSEPRFLLVSFLHLLLFTWSSPLVSLSTTNTMIFAPVVLSFALASVKLVAAQNSTASNNTGLGVAAIEAHFTQAELVPSLLPTFDPSAVLTLSFTGVGDVSPGQALTQQRTSSVIRHPVTSTTHPEHDCRGPACAQSFVDPSEQHC